MTGYLFEDWSVYGMESESFHQRCTIRFHPRVKQSVDLLPKPVRELEQLLDQSIGNDDSWGGSWHPLDRLRSRVADTWSNAALRPWSIGINGKRPVTVGGIQKEVPAAISTPSNTREEVDAGLKIWAQSDPEYQRIYDEIQRQYPLAEESLAEFYQQHFRLSPAKAKILAAFVLDVAFRSHYRFHSENTGYADSLPNPWYEKNEP
ncbi:MAG: hypothetical protein LBE24_10265 [Methylobacillus sp.]|jgi:hypothetical protein|nr:hypothetical protein [Methylobacillus sp.]